MSVSLLFYLATLMQCVAIVVAIYLMRKRGAWAAWLWLIGAMLSMLTWRVVVLLDIDPPPFFNPLIAIWGSTCLLFGMFLFAKQIAARERAEAERDALLESERVAREQSERANRVKDEFLATLSHELRTPLTAILGWCELLRSNTSARHGQDQSEITEALDTIERNARTQARLVEDLLDMSRINAGTLSLDLKPLTLRRAVEAAVKTVRPQSKAKGVTLEVALDADPGVMGDGLRLQQVVWNLLSNAIKFTPAGGAVSVTLTQTESDAIVTVRDTGEGIAPEFVPHLFGRFRQSDGTSSRRHSGLGLGLSIARSVVEMHGGIITAASEGTGRGATFTVTLPRMVLDPGAAPTTPSTVIGPDALAGLSIIVADDEADVRGVVQRILERHGATVRTAGTAAETIEMLAGARADVLVSDIGLPGEDGYSMIRRWRARPPEEGGAIPAIALTAYARGEDRGRALSSGFDLHLAKPVNPLELVQAVRQCVNDKLTDAPLGV